MKKRTPCNLVTHAIVTLARLDKYIDDDAEAHALVISALGSLAEALDRLPSDPSTQWESEVPRG